MGLPNSNDLSSLEFSLDGSPYFEISVDPFMDLSFLDLSLDGSPFWGINSIAYIVLQEDNRILVDDNGRFVW